MNVARYIRLCIYSFFLWHSFSDQFIMFWIGEKVDSFSKWYRLNKIFCEEFGMPRIFSSFSKCSSEFCFVFIYYYLSISFGNIFNLNSTKVATSCVHGRRSPSTTRQCVLSVGEFKPLHWVNIFLTVFLHFSVDLCSPISNLNSVRIWRPFHLSAVLVFVNA